MERTRRRVAAGVLLGAVFALALGLRAVCGATQDYPDRVSSAAFAQLQIPADGRAVLLVAGDGACAACRRAFEDLRNEDDWESSGLHVALRSEHELEAAGVRLPPGPVPVYLIVDGDGRVLAGSRGYLTPVLRERWVRGVFTAS